MPPSSRTGSYVCLRCLHNNFRRVSSGISQSSHQDVEKAKITYAPAKDGRSTAPEGDATPQTSYSIRRTSFVGRLRGRAKTNAKSGHDGARRNYASTASEPLQLSPAQIQNLANVYKLKNRLHTSLSNLPEAKSDPDGVPIEQVLRAMPVPVDIGGQQVLRQTLEHVYSGQAYAHVKEELDKISDYRKPSRFSVTDEKARQIMEKLGILSLTSGSREKSESALHLNVKQRKGAGKDKAKNEKQDQATASSDQAEVPTNAPPPKDLVATPETSTKRPAKSEKSEARLRRALQSHIGKPLVRRTLTEALARKSTTRKPDVATFETVETANLRLEPLEVGTQPKVPPLSFDLSRVLFNPGVYQLQDPRSRVYNFDPYLERIMPIHQFNFDALNQYVTSSQDTILRDAALQYNKRFIGSSSSMSSAMSHFHFLLSAWRPISVPNLSQNFGDPLRSFTQISRAPSAIFLRFKDGVYAVDADKEYDNANVLMSLGRSMEKLLTLEKDDFELYRRTNDANGEFKSTDPEAYHYSGCGNVLLRSQLDAHDPRLPGTGMFDLKTRAVAGIRMNVQDHEVGRGYQIKGRFGVWESYEREYFDMIRAAFLKYSLQVRMGRMDGIFVAFHNIERIFGFQYVPLPELDMALHGQTDRCLGDREFNASVRLMDQLFELASDKFPQRSLRIHFETRESATVEPVPYMNIFVEPMDEAQVDAIQSTSKAKIAEFEKKLLNPSLPVEDEVVNAELDVSEDTDDGVYDTARSETTTTAADGDTPSPPPSKAADVDLLDKITKDDFVDKVEAHSKPPVMAAWRLRVVNEVNGQKVERPQDLSPEDKWNVKYKIEQLSDGVASREYGRCKNRRKTVLTAPETRNEENFFLRKIRTLSEEGAAWRLQQDELDAGRDVVTLYGPGGLRGVNRSE